MGSRHAGCVDSYERNIQLIVAKLEAIAFEIFDVVHAPVQHIVLVLLHVFIINQQMVLANVAVDLALGLQSINLRLKQFPAKARLPRTFRIFSRKGATKGLCQGLYPSIS